MKLPPDSGSRRLRRRPRRAIDQVLAQVLQRVRLKSFDGRQQRILSGVETEDLTPALHPRPSATKRLALIGRSAREVLADYVEAIELVEPASVPRVVRADVDDDQAIAAAVAARADLIVSGDRNYLLPLGSHQGIDIVEAAEAVRRIASG